MHPTTHHSILFRLVSHSAGWLNRSYVPDDNYQSKLWSLKKKEKEIAGASQGSKQEEKPEAVAEVRKLSEDLHVCSRLRNYRTTADCRTSEAPNSSNQQPSINFRGNATPLRLQTIRLWEEFINVGSRLRRKKGIWFERKKMSLSINMTLSSFPEWLQTNSGARISFVLLHFCVLFVFFLGSQVHNFDFKAVRWSWSRAGKKDSKTAGHFS